MFSVIKGPAPDYLREYVEEAVATLGYFRPDSVDELTTILAELWPTGTNGKMLQKAPHQHLLSDKGRAADPGLASLHTGQRILGNMQRRRDLEAEPQWATFIDRVQFWCLPKVACSAACQMLGEIVPREGRASIPLPGCDREWCTCGWDQLPDD